MFTLIAGGGRTGTQLAVLLLGQGHEVHIIEDRRDILTRMHHELPTEIIVEGHPVHPDVLEQAGIREARILATCLTNDADNLALCFLARARYNVPRTIARINNPRTAWLFDEKFHVDAAINQADLMATLIEEEMALGDMMTLLKLRRGEYALVEETIPAGARATGIAIKDMALPGECVIAAIIRNGQVIVPRGITTFEPGDEVLAVTNRAGAERLAALFAADSVDQ